VVPSESAKASVYDSVGIVAAIAVSVIPVTASVRVPVKELTIVAELAGTL